MKKKILAICGSTRKNSTNHGFIRSIAELTIEKFELKFYDGISDLPHFNPDNDNDHIDEAVLQFRKLIDDSEGFIICTPEYAHGVPGTLKNAIDWTVSVSGFYQKPIMLITASTDGSFAHHAMLEILKAIGVKNIEETNLNIQFAKTKINTENKIVDKQTLTQIIQIIKKFETALSTKGN